jgi:tRNA dimethylallyltransferase
MSPHHEGKVIVVAGPTASGKSDFAVELAQKENGEIISADSRQIYKGLDIGTGKITQEEMKGVPHHMLDVVDAGSGFSVAEYARLARPILEDILARGKTPVICGGTGQYIDALIYDVKVPAVPPNQTLREELEKKDVDELFAELAEKDPYRADAIDRYNKVRLIRALEIANELGSVPPLHEPKLLYETEFYLMHPSRELIRERITKRLEKRLAQGMVDEVKWVMDQGYHSDTMKRFGLEYEIIGKFLEGKISEEEMKMEIINKSMQYAKRQDTWNKKYLPIAKLVEVPNRGKESVILV